MRIAVCRVEDLPSGTATSLEVGGSSIAVFNVDGDLYALDNACAHNGGPLSEGLVKDGVVTCPWHWWRYDIASGARLGSSSIFQFTHAVTVEDGTVIVELAERQAEAPVAMRELLLEHAREWGETT